MPAAVLAALVLAIFVYSRIAPAPHAGRSSIVVGGMPIDIAVDDETERAFVTTAGPAQVVVIDTRQGNILRRIPLATDAIGPITIESAAGCVAVPLASGRDAIIDAATGHLLFRTTAASPNPPAIDRRTGHMFIVGAHGVEMIALRTGRILRRLPVPAPPTSLVDVDTGAGRALIAAGRAITVVDANTGRVLRTLPLADAARRLWVDPHTGRAVVTGIATITVIDIHSGRTLATIRTGRDARVAASAGRRAYILADGPVVGIGAASGPSTGLLTILDLITGAVVRRLAIDPHPLAAFVAPRANRLIVTDAGNVDVGSGQPLGVGTIATYDLMRGQLLRRVIAGDSPVEVLTTRERGDVVVVNDGNIAMASPRAPAASLSVLSLRDGHIVRTIPLGRGAARVGADTRGDRLFVVQQIGLVDAPHPVNPVPAWLRRLAPWVPAPRRNPCRSTGCVISIDD